MSLRTQAKVLRALEEQRFEPVGAAESVQVDVRVVAATNKNLEEEIERGNFREDLFYRLNVIPFHVPPLRERAEDIPLLADSFPARVHHRLRAKAQGADPGGLPGAAGLSLAGKRARAAQSDRADRDPESAGADRRPPYPGHGDAPGRARASAGALRQPAGGARSGRARVHPEESSKRPTETSRGPRRCWAWSAAICTGR